MGNKKIFLVRQPKNPLAMKKIRGDFATDLFCSAKMRISVCNSREKWNLEPKKTKGF